MTKENRKNRYQHYVRNGDTKRAEELLAKYSDVKSEENSKVEKTKKSD